MPRQSNDTMGLHRLWNTILFFLTAVRATGGTFSETEKDILHAVVGYPFIIRRLPMINSTLFITVIKDGDTILNLSMAEGADTNLRAENSQTMLKYNFIFNMSIGIHVDKISTVQIGRMMLVYNQTIQELCLLFVNVSKEDEGIYEMKESFYRTSAIAFETEADMYDRQDGTWYLEIYVLGPDEIMQGYVGGNISMEFKRLSKQYTLYNYEEIGALLAGSSCSVLTDSSLYGRLRCSIDDSGRMYKITIVNVSQRDAGLYKIASGKIETGRCFFSIEDSPTCAVHGDNITIGWFYNQQGMKRTLRVIHPNQGVMMFVNHTNSNYPQIKSNFQHRLLYNGDTLQSFMSFTLLNVRQSDAGLYTIETLHGNTIPGSKELIVEVACSTGAGIQTTVDDVTFNISVTKQEVVLVQPMERQCLPISVVIPVVTVAVVVNIAILTMTGCLIWLHRRNKLETCI